MINLEVEDYCHNCPEFKADVDVDEYGFRTADIFHIEVTTVIRCTHRKRCMSIFEHFEKLYEVQLHPKEN